MTHEQARETVASSTADVVDDQLRALEHERCRAISELDIPTLQRLLDDDLSHTHVTGMTQDRHAYLVALTNRPRTTCAGFIRVRRHGDVAILTGLLTNSFTAAGAPSRVERQHALRVWRRDGGDWRLLAFAASGPLDPRPPEDRDG